MENNLPYVEMRDGTYYVRGQRVSVESIVNAWRGGRSPETISQDFPVLTLAEVYGAVAYYLDHQEEIDQYIAESEQLFEMQRQGARQTDPLWYDELERRFSAHRAAKDHCAY